MRAAERTCVKIRASAAVAALALVGVRAVSACHHDTSNTGEAAATTDPTPPGADGGTAARGPDGVENTDTEAPPAPYVPFDINHVLSTGQSNSVGNDAIVVLSTTQPYSNVMFDVGVIPASGCDPNGCTRYDKPSSLVPLVEGDTFFYPVETMSSGLANEVTLLALRSGRTDSHRMLVSVQGRSGNSYLCLRKGSCDWWPSMHYVQPFDDAMMEVADGKRLAAAGGKTYAVRAVTAIHGENDHYAYSRGTPAFPMAGTDGTSVLMDYADALLEWQRDYETGVKAITGQTVPVPLFINQLSHWNDVPTTRIAYMQLDAHVRSGGKVVMVGPTYQLGYSSTCLHFTSHAERALGEYFAKAYTRVVVEGRRWEPLRPLRVTIAGNFVTAKFHVPVPPLVLDTTRVTDPGNYGFEWYEAGEAPAAITAVALRGPDTVEITLDHAPTGADRRLRYAYTFHGCNNGSSPAHGNLRDSDATPSKAGYELFNWSVHFDVPVAP
jgi:hypothetical protein